MTEINYLRNWNFLGKFIKGRKIQRNKKLNCDKDSKNTMKIKRLKRQNDSKALFILIFADTSQAELRSDIVSKMTVQT